MKMLHRLWADESGAILSSEVMLVSSILVIGVICGLGSLRDSVTTELADLAQALGNVNQSFSFSGTQGHHTFNGGGQFIENTDYTDNADLRSYQIAKFVTI